MFLNKLRYRHKFSETTLTGKFFKTSNNINVNNRNKSQEQDKPHGILFLFYPTGFSKSISKGLLKSDEDL